MKIHITWGTHAINDGPGGNALPPESGSSPAQAWSERIGRRQQGGAAAASVREDGGNQVGALISL